MSDDTALRLTYRPGDDTIRTGDDDEMIADLYLFDEQRYLGPLFAAAPELAAACEAWDKGFVDGEDFDADQFLAWVNRNRRAARAALAKAHADE